MTRKAKPSARKPITNDEVEEQIKEFFERNYDLLRQEGRHVLAEGTKQQALEQALLYWRKLKAIATSVTETEVKLALPGRRTPKGRPYVIEGVVDIVRQDDEIRMYDLKTHEAHEVRAASEHYQHQLNVYAHIWKRLHNQRLSGAAIIATRLPPKLREALDADDRNAIDAEMASWDPVVELPVDEDEVDRTIEDFGRCVDDIEDGKFEPQPPDQLNEQYSTPGIDREQTFAEIHCRNCDARFSCSSYQTYRKGLDGRRSKRHTASMRDDAAERELDLWIEENLTEP